MNIKDKILYTACLLVIGASYYLGKTKEMVSQTFVDRIENNGKAAHIIKQEDCFHPFGKVRFRNPIPKYIGQVYTEDGNHVEKRKTFFTERKARRFVDNILENL